MAAYLEGRLNLPIQRAGIGGEDEDEDEGGINPIMLATLMRRRRRTRGEGMGINPFVLAALQNR